MYYTSEQLMQALYWMKTIMLHNWHATLVILQFLQMWMSKETFELWFVLNLQQKLSLYDGVSLSKKID